LAPRHVRNELSLLSAALSWGAEHGHVSGNVCKEVARPPKRVRERLISDTEYLKVYAIAGESVHLAMALIVRALGLPGDVLTLGQQLLELRVFGTQGFERLNISWLQLPKLLPPGMGRLLTDLAFFGCSGGRGPVGFAQDRDHFLVAESTLSHRLFRRVEKPSFQKSAIRKSRAGHSNLSSSTNPRGAGGATIIGAKMRNDDGPGPQVMDAATLIGDQVVNVADEALGKIEGIMLDVSAGRTAYAVLSFGGFLGMGNKLFAIPWSALTLAAMERFLRRPTKCK